MNNALYFPYIDVPDVQWTSKLLLYWDSVCSIVPMEYWDNPDLHSDYMRNLVQEGLVNQISPARYIYEIPDFENHFIQYINNKYLKNNLRHSSEYSLIHIEKLGRLPDFLTRSALAFKKDDSWYFVRSDVANDFMGYLAGVLSKHLEIAASPVTYELSNRYLFTKRTPFSITTRNPAVSSLRDIAIQKILPTPAKRLNIGELARFKAKYGRLLPTFRNYVEKEIIIISQIQDRQARDEALRLFVEGVKLQSEELVDAMKTNWGNITFGNLLPIIGAGFSTAAATGDLALTAAVTTLTTAIYNAVAGIPQNKKVLVNAPLAYVAHAKRELT